MKPTSKFQSPRAAVLSSFVAAALLAACGGNGPTRSTAECAVEMPASTLANAVPATLDAAMKSDACKIAGAGMRAQLSRLEATDSPATLRVIFDLVEETSHANGPAAPKDNLPSIAPN